MKKFLITLFFTIFALMGCQAQPKITTILTWNNMPSAQGFIIVKWEGTSIDSCPFVDNMSLSDLNLTGLHVDTLGALSVSLTFQTDVNGEYIRCAGFVVHNYGLVSGATLSAYLQKPNVPTRMQFLNIEFQ